jgi:octaprenyl-diphosphate synthase
MPIQPIRALVHDDLDAVNALIIANCKSPIQLIDDLVNHIIQSGGKRLRPLLVLLITHACHYQGQAHIKLAVMIEFFHTATLLHDDVIDESKLRRGQETANTIWGDKASILVGDYLFSRYMQLMIDVGNLTIMQRLTDMAYEIGCGEIQQLSKRHDPSYTEQEYFSVIRGKTSLLFAVSCQISAIISGVEPTVEQALFTYGLHLGNAFQLTDDALDYCSDAATIGKNIGDDLADGKATMPLFHVLHHGNSEQREQVRDSIARGSLEHLPDILAAIADTKAIEHTRHLALLEAQKAQASLNHLPDSPYKDALFQLAEYAALREH